MLLLLQTAAAPDPQMPVSAWIALAGALLAFIVQLVVLVRHITKMEGAIDSVGKDVTRIDERVKRVEGKLEESKVVMLRPHHRGLE